MTRIRLMIADRSCRSVASVSSVFYLLRCRRVDHILYFFYPVSRESAFLCMFLDDLFIGRIINTIDLVFSDITFHPLDRWPEIPDHPAGFFGDTMQIRSAELAGARQFSFDNISWHRKKFRGKSYEEFYMKQYYFEFGSNKS